MQLFKSFIIVVLLAVCAFGQGGVGVFPPATGGVGPGGQADGVETIAATATPTFNCSNSVDAFYMALNQNVTNMTVSAACAGRSFSVTFLQDGTGRTVTFPAIFVNPPPVNTSPGVLAFSANFRMNAAGTQVFTDGHGESLTAGASGGVAINRAANPPTVDIVTSVVPRLGVANTYTAGARQTFTASATVAGLKTACSALPSSPETGDVACDSGDGNKLKTWNGSAWVSGGMPTWATNYQGFLYPLDIPPSSAWSTRIAVANRVELWGLMPKNNMTVCRWVGYFNAHTVNTGVAVRLMTVSGGTATAITDAFWRHTAAIGNFTPQEKTFTPCISLNAGTFYYLAIAAETTGTILYNSSLGNSTGALDMFAAGSRRMYARCTETATGTNTTFDIPTTCTITQETDPKTMWSMVLMP